MTETKNSFLDIHILHGVPFSNLKQRQHRHPETDGLRRRDSLTDLLAMHQASSPTMARRKHRHGQSTANEATTPKSP